jgi:hypothetical protein
MSDWWENKWIVAGLVFLAVLLFFQRDIDIFNPAIRGISNSIVYSFAAPGTLFWVLVIGAILYAFSKRG